ncbi:g11397 [Coccomyxa viridis]|uniref:G11397 protein n=1 Tax=Coccomyxa viridis TaxID=1274662 RepID=A0ABP1G914_9CHLO
MVPAPTSRSAAEWRVLAAFGSLGLLNNAGYVIMIAGANEISQSSVGLVYFCAIFPTLLVKLTGPYWFHYVSYGARMWASAALMSAAYTTVAFSQDVEWQLLGVVLSAVQGGLGEASCLAMCTFFDSRAAITLWSSGTGFAGVAGYTWVGVMHTILGFSFATTLMIANATSVAWLLCYYLLLKPATGAPHRSKSEEEQGFAESAAWQEPVVASEKAPINENSQASLAGLAAGDALEEGAPVGERLQLLVEEQPSSAPAPVSNACPGPLAPLAMTHRMHWRERLQRTLDLWPYMAPLTLVYFAEYVLQSGAWTAIGFPVDSPDARHTFYTYANWVYQIGVFTSRSSGLLFQADRGVLLAMPLLQVGMLVFFLLVAVFHFMYSWWLLSLCLCTGLLGGAVYVNAFTLLAKEVEPSLREFSLSAASLADSVGIALADICGIMVQGCLFKANGLTGAAFKCSTS